MTLPASGSVSTAQIRTELGGSGPVTFPNAETRALTGVGAGAITLPTGFYGKSGTPAFSASNNGPANAAGAGPSQTTNSVTVTPSGGTAPYSYAWAKDSGDTISANSPTAATTSFTGSTADGETASAVFTCTVTDNVGAKAYTSVVVTLTDTSPPL